MLIASNSPGAEITSSCPSRLSVGTLLQRARMAVVDIVSGIQNLEWRFYIIFAVLNASFIPIIWFFYMETAGLSLDEIDRVFEIKYAPGQEISYKEASERAKEELEAERLHIRDLADANGAKESAGHLEKIA